MPSITAGQTISDSAQINPGVIVNSDINASAGIEGSKLQALSVGANAGVIPSTGVANAHIAAAAAIAITKIAAITQGGVLVGGASGVVTDLGAGTSGQVLTSQGAGATPTWTPPASPFFVEFQRSDANLLANRDGFTGVQFADGTTTARYANFYAPSGGLTSIQLVGVSLASGAGNVVFDYAFANATDGSATTTDSATTQVVTDFASNVLWQFVTVPTTAYNGLTAGRPWGFTLTRQGTHGSDTLAQTVLIAGFLVTP